MARRKDETITWANPGRVQKEIEEQSNRRQAELDAQRAAEVAEEEAQMFARGRKILDMTAHDHLGRAAAIAARRPAGRDLALQNLQVHTELLFALVKQGQLR